MRRCRGRNTGSLFCHCSDPALMDQFSLGHWKEMAELCVDCSLLHHSNYRNYAEHNKGGARSRTLVMTDGEREGAKMKAKKKRSKEANLKKVVIKKGDIALKVKKATQDKRFLDEESQREWKAWWWQCIIPRDGERGRERGQWLN